MSIHWHAIWNDLFGWPGTWGTGGNMVAWVICGTLGLGWLHAKEKARHIQKMAQSARHHAELLDQADTHHKAVLAAVGKHHQELLDRADTHHEALKAHVSRELTDHHARLAAVVGAPPPKPPAAAARTKGTRL